MVNSSLELTCSSINKTVTYWVSTQDTDKFSMLTLLQEGECSTEGFLADNQYFETSCYINGTFKVKIKHVNISYQGQRWTCNDKFSKSNYAKISVKGKFFSCLLISLYEVNIQSIKSIHVYNKLMEM
jgi:hypothetical protein